MSQFRTSNAGPGDHARSGERRLLGDRHPAEPRGPGPVRIVAAVPVLFSLRSPKLPASTPLAA